MGSEYPKASLPPKYISSIVDVHLGFLTMLVLSIQFLYKKIRHCTQKQHSLECEQAVDSAGIWDSNGFGCALVILEVGACG